ncbi:MAG: alpha/beta fold hydrolase, partial [Acidimicrobiales bacterium]
MASPAGRHLRLGTRGSTFVRYHRGSPGMPTLLLLHGWTATSDLNWSTSYGSLAERYSFVAIDMRGHGRGLRTRDPFSLEDCADDAALALDCLGVDKVIVVGYSMGGAVAQLFWRRHHQRCEGIVLCSTGATFNDTPREHVLFGGLTSVGVVARFTPADLRTRAVTRYLSKRTDADLREPAIGIVGTADPVA